MLLFHRPRRLALHTLCAEVQGGGRFKHAFKRDNHEWLLASGMTWLVKHIRNLPFVQGLFHGSCLWRALQASPPLGCSGAPLGQINSPFAAAKQHGLNGDGGWWFTPVLLKIRNLGLSHLHWKFWQILEHLGVWIQGRQHYLLSQEKTSQDRWDLWKTVEADLCMKVWYYPAVTSAT